jgi:hypothetical protein
VSWTKAKPSATTLRSASGSNPRKRARDWLTVAVSLGHALPETSLTSREKKELKKRADKIVLAELIKIVEGRDVDLNMRQLAWIWLRQQQRGRGRPGNKVVQKGLIIEAVSQEYKKHFNSGAQKLLDEISEHTGLRISLRAPMRKLILGAVGDRVGLGMERMKQLAPSGISEFNKAVKRVGRKRRRK